MERIDTGDGVQKGGLAGTVGANNGNDPLRINGKRHVAEGLQIFESNGDFPRIQNCGILLFQNRCSNVFFRKASLPKDLMAGNSPLGKNIRTVMRINP